MRKLPVLLALACLAAFSRCAEPEYPARTEDCTPPAQTAQHPRAAEYQAVLQQYVGKGLPGISALVEDSAGLWVGSAGYADVENGIRFQPCHLSKVASITKLVVGVAVHKLVEEGKLSLDDPISKFIDQTKLDKIRNAEGKTVRDLMRHTTGIFDVITSNRFYLAVLNNPNRNWSADDLLEYVYGVDGYALNNPYPAYYSNTNTLLLSLCMEKATGRPHLEVVREKVLQPLGMTSTYYQGREAIPATAAQGYYDLYNNGTIANVSQLVTGSGNGYGGMYSNVYDLKKLVDNVLKGTYLSEQARLEMATVAQEDSNFYCGAGTVHKRLGHGPNRTMGFGHTGRDLGYVANCFYYPSRGATIIFFVNYGTNGDSRLKPTFFEFEEAMADAVFE